MCGLIAVIARPGRFQRQELASALNTLHHRGPDRVGLERVSATEHWEVWLGHKRLAILDLSSDGDQPMTRSDRAGRSGSIVFNGEFYNHAARRAELEEGFAFGSRSDTEVLLAGLLAEGGKFLASTNAMLATVLYDHNRRRLVLGRDRLGKKPLYVYRGPDLLVFASELKAIVALGLPLNESPLAWAHYHWLRHVPAPLTIYEQCEKFPAASYAELSLDQPELPSLDPHLYWDPLAACGQTFAGSYEEAIERFFELLDDATRLRLEADVPVGVFLSSGIDSSLVAASVARQSQSTTAYIVKAASSQHDESEVAQRTAERLGLRPYVLELGSDAYERQIKLVPTAYDEPCAPLSQIATLAIAEAAAQHVKVVLTGDGGDEVFVGYPWFGYPEKLFAMRQRLEYVPGLRRLAAVVAPSRLGRLSLLAATVALGRNLKSLSGKQWVAAQTLKASEPAQIYDCFQELRPYRDLSRTDKLLLGSATLLQRAQRAHPDYSWEAAQRRPVTELVAALELVTLMRDEILAKVDRATMAYSLEARSPLLDYRMVEFGLSLPLPYKARGSEYKRLLRDACARRVGEDVARLKKRGFGIPLPSGLPEGETEAVRWAQAVEQDWNRTWREAKGPRSASA